MLNLTDHLRRLRVDKYEYIAMKVIVLLQSGECVTRANGMSPLQSLNKMNFIHRHIRFTGTGKGVCQSRESATSTTTVYVIALS